MFKKNIILLLLLLNVSALWAGYNPRTNWKEITSDHFHIIYDEVLEEDVIDLIEKMEGVFDLIADDLGGEIDRYTIILPSGILESNGYVTPIGDKSVFYSRPPSSSFAGNMEWYNLLAIHETRHMVQFTRMKDSFMQKILHFLLGDYGILPTFYTFPTYFFEGDAVLTETLLSESGRGRSPGFEMNWRAALLSGKKYPYGKVFHGSDKDYTPNPYILGYYLMTYLKREVGAKKYERILGGAANNPLPMNYSFSTILNGQGSMPSLYNDVTDELTELWSEQDKKVTPTETKKLKQSEKGFQHYMIPQYDESGNLVYLYYDYDTGAYLVRESDGEEEKFSQIDHFYSLNGSRLTYTKRSSHPRWTYEEYSDVYTYDLDNKQELQLTEYGRYAAPEFSKDGSLISAVEFTKARVPAVSVIDSIDGEVIYRKEFKDSEFIRDLTFGDDNKTLYFVDYKSDKSALVRYDLSSDKLQYLSEYGNYEIMELEYADGVLYYVSSQSGIYDIYAYNISNDSVNRVISSRFGSKHPHVYDNTLYFNQYTEYGYNIEFVSVDSLKLEPQVDVVDNHVNYFEPLLTDITYDTTDVEYQIDNYNPYMNLLNFHSWLLNPFGMKIEEESDMSYDFRLISNDDHELLDLEMVFMLSHSAENFMLGSIGEYRGLYPIAKWNTAYFTNSGYPGYFDNVELEVPYYLQDFTASYFVGENHNFNSFFENEHYLSLYGGISLSYEEQDLSIYNRTQYRVEVISRDDQVLSNQFSVDWKYLSFSNSIDQSMLGYYFQTPSRLWTDKEVGYQGVMESSIDFGGNILKSEWSLFNWLYINDFDLYGGYSSLYTSSSRYDQYLWAKIRMRYFLLRTNVELKTEFTFYIDPLTGDYKANVIPIWFHYN